MSFRKLYREQFRGGAALPLPLAGEGLGVGVSTGSTEMIPDILDRHDSRHFGLR